MKIILEISLLCYIFGIVKIMNTPNILIYDMCLVSAETWRSKDWGDFLPPGFIFNYTMQKNIFLPIFVITKLLYTFTSDLWDAVQKSIKYFPSIKIQGE